SDGRVSCATCHPIATGGTTPEPLTRRAVGGAPASFNTPSVWNAPIAAGLSWHGDASYGDVVRRSLTTFMGNATAEDAIVRLRADPEFMRRFTDADVPLDLNNMSITVEAYLRAVMPRRTRYDAF